MSDTLAVIAGKISARVIRAAGVGLGSNLPGRVSRAVSKTVLSKLASQARRGVVAVTGTNGKSTTSGLVSSIFEKAKLRIAHNRQGANLVPGITASLIEAASWNGRLNVDFCLFEADEAALPLVAKEVKIGTIVVTNLFRDQLDRFGELDTTAALINKGIAANASLAVLNADDPNVSQLAPGSKRVFFGLKNMLPALSENSTTLSGDQLQELAYCPSCGSEYSYARVFYGQLGHYACSSCGHARPEPEVVASDVSITATGSSFYLLYKDRRLAINLALPGLFNVYNALSAAALAFTLELPDEAIKAGLENYTTLFGRSERWKIDGKTALIQLIKNPAGASQAVQAAAADPQARLLIAINDNYADGRDVSWLWDAEFELIGKHDKKIWVSGIRCHDMALRLKYAGVPAGNIETIPDLDTALKAALNETGAEQTLWILPTYTCLLELQKIARSMGHALSGT